MSVWLSRLYFIIYSHSAWLDYSEGWSSLLLLQSFCEVNFWIYVDYDRHYSSEANYSVRPTFLLFLCYVYIQHYCSPPPAIISAVRMVLEWWYTEKQTVLHTSNDCSNLVLTSANISWSSSGYYRTRFPICLMKVTLFIDRSMYSQVLQPWYAWTSYIGVLSLDKIVNQVTVSTVGNYHLMEQSL